MGAVAPGGVVVLPFRAGRGREKEVAHETDSDNVAENDHDGAMCRYRLENQQVECPLARTMKINPQYDCIVVGLGAMGSAALYQLMRRGVRALGIEQFRLGHDRGSSHGRTRVFRTAYAEMVYAKMAGDALSRWKQLEVRSGQQLIELVGALSFASEDNEHFRQVNAVHDALQLPYEVLSGREASRRFDAFSLGDDIVACYARSNGFLHADRCLDAMQALAVQGGSEIWEETGVDRIETGGNGVVVHAGGRCVHAAHVVITAGPWLGRSATELNLPLKVTREQKVYFDVADLDRFCARRLPVFAHYDTDVYGFPLQDAGLKLAVDYSGHVVDPDQVDRTVDRSYIKELTAWVHRWMPTAAPRPVESAVCLYTTTPDRDFIIDRHPSMDHVVIAGGFSGHGFKFSILVGDIVADLVVDGVTPHPIRRFGIGRFQ